MPRKNEYSIYVKIGIGIILFIIGWPLLKNVLSWTKNKINLEGAVSNATEQANTLNPVVGNTTTRVLKIQGFADTLQEYFKGSFNHATSVVNLLNSLLNDSEVVALSNYYQSTYNASLLSKVHAELDSWVNMTGKGWKDLKPFVQNNLI